METKEMKIQVPEGYEIDKENSTFECIKLKPIKRVLSYEDVARELFEDKEICYINAVGIVNKGKVEKAYISDPNNCTSQKQAEKLIAINKLMNVAKYLNEGWVPNWTDVNIKYYIYYSRRRETLDINWDDICNQSVVYFKSEELAKRAIEILGEGTIMLALSTDW